MAIVAIEHSSASQKNIKDILEEAGFEIYFFSPLDESLREIEKKKPEIILLESYDAESTEKICLNIRHNNHLKNVPILLIADESDYESIKNFVSQGLGNDFFRKPIKRQDFLERIEINIARSKIEINNRSSLHDSLDLIGDLASDLENKNYELSLQLKKQKLSNVGFVNSLVRALESKDTYTAFHSTRVTRYALRAATKVGFPKKKLEKLRKASMLHDIGKIGIDLSYISKPTALTRKEFKQMSLHPEIGAKILRPLNFLEDELNIVLHHHERWDGEGYPEKLKKNQISLLSGILSVSDAYDAMTSDRSYRLALKKEQALQEIRKNRELQFHPEAVDAFLNSLN